MKQEAKKNKKLVWLVAALAALLIVVGVVLALVLPQQQGDPANDSVSAELYWNVDRLTYTENAEIEGSSDRTAAEDGNYYIRFAYEGQQVELQIIDKQLVNWIDQRDLVGLIFDADGVVIDAVEADEVATKTAQGAYVRAVNGNEVTINTSSAMNGMESVLVLTENTGIYDVDPKAEVVGARAELGIMDQILVYSNEQEEVTHIYITERAPDAEIYWRLDRMWDSTNGITTREPDENGVYTIAFAHDGEHVELKTKSLELVNYVDSQAPLTAMFAPVFDEEGYIIEFVSVALSLRGTLKCSDYHVTAVDGDNITATKLSDGAEQGKVVNFTLNDACRIYMCCDGCYEHLEGEKITELKMYDRVYVYTDLEGNPVMIFVARRVADCSLYYNLERMYANGKTSREPVNGYYVFEMASEGKKVTLRTKDEKLANEIDALYHQAMGLKVNGDIIERVYPLYCVNGGGDYGTNRYLTMLTGPVFEATYYTDFENKANCVMSADCKIYDVTTGFYGVEVGEETTVNLYDKITYLKDMNGEISTIFVTDRYVDAAPIYYNADRKYDSKTESTTRVADENGYYVFDMISGGKTVQVKTKNKDLASFIDKQSSPLVALKVSGGVVKAAYPAAAAVKYSYKIANYHYVDKVNKDGSFTTYYYSDGVKHKSTYTFWMTDDCVVYNVSNAYDNTRGEKTKLKAGDQIQAFAVYPSQYPDVDIPLIYVLNRKLDSPMYKNVKQMYNWTTKETTREPNADGWYVFDLAANGTVKQYKTKDREIATQVDSYDLGFTLVTDGDIILRVCSPTLCKDVSSSTGSNHDVMTLNGNKASLKRNQPNSDKYGATAEVTFAKNCVFYDYSPYAENFGAETTLSVGDRIHCYTNQEGEVVICFILYKNTHEKGHISYCEHCDKEVFWNPYTGSIGAPDAHYYVTHDGNITYQGMVGNSTAAKEDQTDVVIDLNGHDMTTTNRGFLVYGTLSILDTVGGGSVTAGNKVSGNGGCIMVTNEGTLNLYDGVLSVAQGVGKPNIGGVIYLGGDATMNMYGGRITGGYAADRGGNIIVNSGVLNISGGTIDGGTAENNGNNIMATMSSTVNISGGKITGDVVINSKSVVTLSGSPVITKGQISGMSLATGLIVDVTGLKQDASVVISASGQFTDKLTNAQSYLSNFIKEKQADDIYVKEDALYYDKAPKDLNNVDNSALSFEAGTTKAYCPYCERTVTWTELTSTDTTLDLSGGEHYYLAGDVTYSGAEWLLRAPSTDAVSCVHLNGHNITATNGRVAQGYPGILNIMGEGIVSGNFTYAVAKDQGSTINTNTNNSNGAINLIGGVYTAPESNTQNSVVSVAGNGGTVNIYDGAKIESGSKAYSVHVGVASLTDGTFGMYGGTLSGSIYMSAPSASAGHSTILNISGGTVNGGVQLGATTTVNLSGDPVISGMGMVVPAGAKISLGELTQGAEIRISASGVFTEENENAANYAGFFIPADGKAEIIPEGNALRYTFPGAIELDADGYAYCEACAQKVKWEVISGQVYKPADGGHYYFKSTDGSGVVSTPWQLITWPDDITADYKLCLHLNGQRVETGSRMFLNMGTVNILGEGTLAGTGTTTSPALLTGTITVNGGTVNLSGGTFTSEKNGVPAISTYYSSATVNLHNATVVGGVDVNNGNLCLNGATVIEKGTSKGLVVAEGTQITVNELTENADITVSATGVFTKENENMGAYLDYFKPSNANDQIDVQNNALVYTVVPVDLNAIDNTELAFAANTTNADCPVCGETVTWTALSGDAAVTLSGGGHYYLSDDVTYTGTDAAYLTAPGSGLTACVHLNGHDITATAYRVIEGNGSTLNIMGEGTVSGSYNDNRLYGATINMAAGESEGNINLIGGTYTKNTACDVSSIVMLRNGGDVNLYAGAQILGVNDGKGVTNVSVFYHSFNMYGGKLSGGTGTQVTTNNWSSTKTGLFTMTGGEITGNVAINGNANKYGGSTISGGTINGTVTYARYTTNAISGGTITEGITLGSTATSDNSSITVSGAPVITGVGMKLNTGYLLTLGELNDGADILISASGVFTSTTEKAADYAKHFKAPEGYEVVVRSNALSCAAEGILELDANGNGYCDACQQTVKWTAVSGAPYKQPSGSHCYFVSKDGSDLVSTPYQLATWPDDINADYKLCLHLNGHRVETGSRLLMNTGTVNIMGKGVLAGTGTTTSTNLLTGTLTVNGGTLNLYGGVYTSDVKGVPAIITKYNSAIVNLYNASVVGGYEISKGTLNLSGPSVVDMISVTEGKLNVMENWTGTATAAFASLAENSIPAANGTSEGNYTGNLFLADSTDSVIKGVDGTLKITSYSREDDGVLKILAVGNSFAVDSTNLLYEIYKAENPNKQIVIGVLNCSGAALLTHVRNLNGNLGSYYYHKLDSDIYTGGKWKITSKATILEALRDEDWDIVTIQQASGSTPDAATYNGYIGAIRNYVTGNLGYVPEFGWNFTWAYPDDDELLSTNTASFIDSFKNNYGTSEAMYNKINQAVQEKIVNGAYSFDYLMPVGTAIQNARIQGLTAKDLYRDSLHLNNLGRLIAAYTWYCELEGVTLTDLKLTQIPAAFALTDAVSNGVTELDEGLESIVIEAVNSALSDKFTLIQKP